MAQVLVSKCADHCLLYRQRGVYWRAGVALDHETLADRVRKASTLLLFVEDSVAVIVASPIVPVLTSKS